MGNRWTSDERSVLKGIGVDPDLLRYCEDRGWTVGQIEILIAAGVHPQAVRVAGEVGWDPEQVLAVERDIECTPPDVVHLLARSQHATVVHLTLLAHHPNSRVRREAARRPRLPADLIPVLVSDPDPGVRLTIVTASTDPLLLERMARDPVADVRMAAASNVHTPPSAMAHLLDDPLSNLRMAAIFHPHTPRHEANKLRRDPDPEVRRFAVHHLAGDPGRADTSEPPNWLVEYLSQRRHPQSVAADPHTPGVDLELLAITGNAATVAQAARNPNLPASAFAWLVKHTNPDVVHALVDNPSCPPNVLGILAEHPDLDLVRSVAGHEHTAALTLAHLSYHHDRLVRYAVAENLSTPTSLLNALAQESGTLAGAVARMRLTSRSPEP